MGLPLLWLSASLTPAQAQDEPEAEPPTSAAREHPSGDGEQPRAASPRPLSLAELGVGDPGPRTVDYNAATSGRNAGSYLWPLFDVFAINFTLWSIPYVLGVEFAQVTPSLWRQNFQSGLQWDDNEFEVNQFAHPYQGGMYFSAARVHGLSFWEAIPYTMFGSLSWEFFAETEQPSTNDWLNTTWGGFMFGESLYRLSNSILDDSTSGSTRFWKELGAFAVNPMNGLDRLISGQAWADGPPGESVPLRVNLRVGPDGIGLSEGTGWGETVRAWIRFDYGDLYARPSITTPFQAFNIAAQLSVGSDIFGQEFDGTGVLLGHRLSMGPGNVGLLAWNLKFQYFTNATTQLFTRQSAGVYQLGEMGTGLGWFGHFSLPAGFSIDAEADVLAVPTGAITSPYARFEANRSYSYGVGGASKLQLELRHDRWGRLYAKSERYLYYVVDGARGVEHLGTLQLGAYVNVYSGHGLGATALRYDRHSYYDDYPDFYDAFWTGQVHYEVEF